MGGDKIPAISTRRVLEQLGFAEDPTSHSDEPPAYVYDFGNLQLTAAHVTNQYFRRVVMLSGVAKSHGSIRQIRFEMPPEVESFEQGVAWIVYGVDDFRPLRPVPWLELGHRNQGLLPWNREQEAYQRRPRCSVEKDWFKLASKKLREVAKVACERDLAWFAFDGEGLRISACGRRIIVPAEGNAWDRRYAINAVELMHLPQRLAGLVSVSVWASKLTIGNRSWPVTETAS